MESNPLEWRWVNEKGVHNVVDSRELVNALLGGRMTPHVWVWRTGWTSWLRASQVADLATVIPEGARLPSVAVAIDINIVKPPPVPSHTFKNGSYVRRMSTPVRSPPGAVPLPPQMASSAFALDLQRAIDRASFLADSSESTVSAAPDLVMRSVLGSEETSVAAHLTEPPSLTPTHSRHSLGAQETACRRKRFVLAGAAIVVVSMMVSMAVFGPHGTSRRAAGATSTASPSQRPPMQPCRVVSAAERLAPSIALAVVPNAVTAPDGKAIAVGFADTATSAAGILVDPLSRSVKYTFHETGNDRVTSVVPRISGTQLTFAVARDSDSLKEARLVPSSPDLKLGQTLEGFSRQFASGPPEIVWPIDIDTPCTGARIATGAGSHAVTFRQGGQNGSVQVGWLTEDGHNRFAPVAVETEAKSAGQPSIASNGARVLVTFAGRNAESDSWGVHLAFVPNDGTAAHAVRLSPVPGGPGGDAIAPAAVGLDDGHFLLQWSEGSAGHRQVRVQTLDANLQPWGSPATISPPEANAGQGALWVSGEKGLSLFIVNVGKGAELWAASLQCGG